MGDGKRNIDIGFNFLLQINRRKSRPKQNEKNTATADSLCQYSSLIEGKEGSVCNS